MRSLLPRGLALLAALLLATAHAIPPAAQPPAPSRVADFAGERPSAEARHVADWAVHSGDHRQLPFVVVDKLAARVYVFGRTGRLLGAAPALIGSAPGDASVAGIGERKLSSILPSERTTPAGRFVASLARSLHGEEILWVDYDAAIALHRVIATVPKERRLQRLASAVPLERRITYGCINVPVAFYEEVVSVAFRGTEGIVYVLPESGPARALFGSYEVEGRP